MSQQPGAPAPLTEAEARESLARAGSNELEALPQRGVGRILRSTLSEPMFAMLLAAAALYLLLGDIGEGALLVGGAIPRAVSAGEIRIQPPELPLACLPRALLLRNVCGQRGVRVSELLDEASRGGAQGGRLVLQRIMVRVELTEERRHLPVVRLALGLHVDAVGGGLPMGGQVAVGFLDLRAAVEEVGRSLEAAALSLEAVDLLARPGLQATALREMLLGVTAVLLEALGQ